MQRQAAAHVAFDTIGDLVDDVIADCDTPIVAGETEPVDRQMIQAANQLGGDIIHRIITLRLV